MKQKKTISLDMLFLSGTELNCLNITEIPIERLYYTSYRGQQIVIHFMQNKYYIYTMNWLPKFYTDTHYKEFIPNKWLKIVGYSNVEDAKRIYNMYVKEMLGLESHKTTLEDCINYLTDLKKITGELN